MVFFFLESVTEDSCISPIFFIFSSISIFCSSFFISVFRSLTVSSLWCCLATAVAQAEWIAVIQFSSSVWLEVWGEGKRKKEVKILFKIDWRLTTQFQGVLFPFDRENQSLKSTYERSNKKVILNQAIFSTAQHLKLHIYLCFAAVQCFPVSF